MGAGWNWHTQHVHADSLTPLITSQHTFECCRGGSKSSFPQCISIPFHQSSLNVPPGQGYGFLIHLEYLLELVRSASSFAEESHLISKQRQCVYVGPFRFLSNASSDRSETTEHGDKANLTLWSNALPIFELRNLTHRYHEFVWLDPH